MDHPRSTTGTGEDNVGIPDDLRCKRSDGKQWRCTAMSMPDKTVCEKHYIQAKKRAANSAMRANLKKAKRKSLGESDIYLESKSDDFDVPLVNMKEYPLQASGKKYSERAPKNKFRYSPETPPVRSFSIRNPPKQNDDSQLDIELYEENNWRSYKTPPVSAMDLSGNRSQRSLDANATTVSEYSDQSTESSEETGGQTCHQC
ncbi:uncharacterized protein LOC21384026, partial [Morus notabilis]|uniref:uncharacterized protein LOC21384026 n=1 Tax=Morus notabilis TaxID=981085 RepID=UPI000CED2A7A